MVKSDLTFRVGRHIGFLKFSIDSILKDLLLFELKFSWNSNQTVNFLYQNNQTEPFENRNISNGTCFERRVIPFCFVFIKK